MTTIGCGENPHKPNSEKMIRLQGKTMGTTYSVLYINDKQIIKKTALDSLLAKINDEVSTYIPSSTISKISAGKDSTYNIEGKNHFVRNFQQSKTIYSQTDGWFNPCVMPLVNYWGFGYTEKKAVEQADSNHVDSLLQLVKFDQLILKNNLLQKKLPNIQLDFSAIAKGDAVDQLGLYLEEKGIKNYLVEIGGEVRARGHRTNKKSWNIGINTPQENAPIDDFHKIVQLENVSLATSGNYRNYYEVNGKKYAHTINPNTGYPEKNRLLSVSVIAPNCGQADAFATAFMAMGQEKAIQLAEQLEDIEIFCILSNEKEEMLSESTNGFKKYILK